MLQAVIIAFLTGFCVARLIRCFCDSFLTGWSEERKSVENMELYLMILCLLGFLIGWILGGK